jgi:ABC-type bacteriocin/lantibiotic exporter with double-glycine peptidase domain
VFNPFIKKTPHRRQIEPIECGAICLGIILESFGRYVTHQKLRDACKVSRNGSHAANLIAAGNQFSLSGIAKNLLASDVRKIKQPCILFFDFCHFVVFEGHFLQRFYLNDPARGRYSLDAIEFQRRFSKIALIFTQNKNFTTDGSQTTELPPFDKMTKALLACLGLFFGINFIILAGAIGLLFGGGQNRISLDVWQIIVGMLTLGGVVVCAYWILWHTIKNSSAEACWNEITFLRTSLLKIPFSFFYDVPFSLLKNTFATSITRSLMSFQVIAYRYFFLFFALVIIIALIVVSPWIALALLFSCVLFFAQIFFERMCSKNKVYEGDYKNLFFKHLPDMRMMGQNEFLIDGLLTRKIESLVHNINKKQLLIKPFLSPALPIAAFIILFCFIVSEQWHGGSITLTEIYAILILSYGLAYATTHFFFSSSNKYEESMFLLRELAEQTGKKTTISLPSSDSNVVIQVKNLHFAYRGEDKNIWDGINIKMRHGEIIGLVGASLSGKSTLMRLIAGKILPSQGEVIHFVKGSDSLRIASLDDDADLINASLKDNVTLFDHRINESEIVTALEEACATDLFYNRPMGLLTPIIAQGKNVSTGEKKRLLLAQALVQKPDVILLDNFFESLDENVSTRIIKNLKHRKISTIFSSFRRNELKDSDRVILIENEKLVIIDHHEHLYEVNKYYRQLLIINAPLDTPI